jgi:hypothetical protein
VEEIWHVWMCLRCCELANETLISGERDLIVMEHVLNIVSVLHVITWTMEHTFGAAVSVSTSAPIVVSPAAPLTVSISTNVSYAISVAVFVSVSISISI